MCARSVRKEKAAHIVDIEAFVARVNKFLVPTHSECSPVSGLVSGCWLSAEAQLEELLSERPFDREQYGRLGKIGRSPAKHHRPHIVTELEFEDDGAVEASAEDSGDDEKVSHKTGCVRSHPVW